MNQPPSTFTASEIAQALRRSKRGIIKTLENVLPTTKRIVCGNDTCAWAFSALPQKLKEELSAEAETQRCRNAERNR
jgi:hypothetical protein